jgi:hypothetical protein
MRVTNWQAALLRDVVATAGLLLARRRRISVGGRR